MDHAVAHRADLVHAGDDAVFRVGNRLQHRVNGLDMAGHGVIDGVDLLLAFDLGLVGELAVDADALAQSLG